MLENPPINLAIFPGYNWTISAYLWIYDYESDLFLRTCSFDFVSGLIEELALIDDEAALLDLAFGSSYSWKHHRCHMYSEIKRLAEA